MLSNVMTGLFFVSFSRLVGVVGWIEWPVGYGECSGFAVGAEDFYRDATWFCGEWVVESFLEGS